MPTCRQVFATRLIRLVAPLLSTIMGLSNVSVATVLAVIKTKDGYWIAADSKRGTGRIGTDSVCKIHETSIGVIAKASAAEGFTRRGMWYSLDVNLADLAERSKSSAEFKQSLKMNYEQEVWDQLAYVTRLPNLSKDQIRERHFHVPLPASITDSQFRQVLLIAVEDGLLTLRQLIVAPQSELLDSGEHRYFVDVLDWPVIDERLLRPEDVKHPSLHQFAFPIKIEENDEFIQSHPEQVLRNLLQRGTELDPGAVGPPYSIAHVYLSSDSPSGFKVTWVSQGNCPSWNFRPRTPNYIK